VLPLFSFSAMEPRAVGPSLLSPPPEGRKLSFTSMRPCGSHRPPDPLRFFNLASSASSSFVFRSLRDVDVGGACSPSRRVLPVLCKSPCYSYEKRAHLPRQRTTRRGLRFRTSPSWCSSSAALVSRMWVNTRASFARCHLTEIVVGTTTEGGMWPDFVFVFVFLRVPY